MMMGQNEVSLYLTWTFPLLSFPCCETGGTADNIVEHIASGRSSAQLR